MANIPGVVAKHAIITPRCRAVERFGDPIMDAFDEAVRRLRDEYAAVARYRPDDWTGHIVFTVQDPNPEKADDGDP